MNASCKAGGSYTFRSILYGRDLLRGKSSTTGSSLYARHHSTRVFDLLSPEDDASDIKQIPVGGNGVDDYLAWNYTKDGVFTVRSACHLLMSMKRARTGRPKSSLNVNSHRSWLALWGTHVPNKVEVHSS